MTDETIAKDFLPFFRRALDLAAANQGAVSRGPWIGWVVTDGAKIIDEGSTQAAPLGLPAKSSENCTLFLSINPFATARELAVWCDSLSTNKCFVATAPESPVRHEALHLNRRFLTWQQQKRPYLILKWAETADGFIAPAHTDPYWISNAHARRLVHQWRSQEAAIWVGKNTCLRDNPRLNVRHWNGANPLRVVVDLQLRLPDKLHIFDRSQPTLCYNAQKTETHENLAFVQIPENHSFWNERIRFVLDDLYARQIQSVLVEGGPTLLSFLIGQGWWDETRVFRAPVSFRKGLSAPAINDLHCVGQQRISDNTLTVYRNPKS